MTEDRIDSGARPAPPEAGETWSMKERRQDFLEASERIARALKAQGVTEEDVERHFAEWRKTRRRTRPVFGEAGTSGPSRT